MAKQKIRLHLLKGDQIDAESVLAMYTAITGREPTPDEVAEVRREMEDYEDGRKRRKEK